jgi:hypothetical protein
MLREWSNTARNIGHIGRILDACFGLNLQELAENVKGGPLHKALSALPRSAFMEPAFPLVTGSRYSGNPVYFVNGIWTPKDKAIEAAEQLAHHLRRPVYLIYNPSVLNSPGFRTGTPGASGAICGKRHTIRYGLWWCVPWMPIRLPEDGLAGCFSIPRRGG